MAFGDRFKKLLGISEDPRTSKFEGVQGNMFDIEGVHKGEVVKDAAPVSDSFSEAQKYLTEVKKKMIHLQKIYEKLPSAGVHSDRLERALETYGQSGHDLLKVKIASDKIYECGKDYVSDNDPDLVEALPGKGVLSTNNKHVHDVIFYKREGLFQITYGQSKSDREDDNFTVKIGDQKFSCDPGDNTISEVIPDNDASPKDLNNMVVVAKAMLKDIEPIVQLANDANNFYKNKNDEEMMSKEERRASIEARAEAKSDEIVSHLEGELEDLDLAEHYPLRGGM